MSTRLVKHIFSFDSLPLYAVAVASLISLGLLVIHMIGMDLWEVALLILLAWLPIIVVKTNEIYKQYHWLAFFFVLLVAQSVHFTEHIAQMIQIHLMGLSGVQAHGIIGMLTSMLWLLMDCTLPMKSMLPGWMTLGFELLVGVWLAIGVTFVPDWRLYEPSEFCVNWKPYD
jgi:hypothetical protein